MQGVIKYIRLSFLVLCLLVVSCAGTRPPGKVAGAIHVVTVNLENYVAHANEALAVSDDPDRQLWIGVGERLVTASRALDAWGGGE